MMVKKQFLLIVSVVMACMLVMTACKKKPTDIKPGNKAYYELIILSSEERSMIVFENHTSAIASVS